MLQAVILDMDGLLIDSEPLWQQAEIEVFHTVNLNLTPQLCELTRGLRIDAVVDYWYAKFPWSKFTKKQIAENIVERVIELIRLKGEPLPGVDYILNFFKSQDVAIALASSSSYLLIEAVVERLGLGDVFEVIYSATEEEYGKPHPAVYLTTAEKLQVLPCHCLALEDSLNGVLAAKAARMKCLAVPEYFPNHSPKFIIADVILESLHKFTSNIWQQLNED